MMKSEYNEKIQIYKSDIEKIDDKMKDLQKQLSNENMKNYARLSIANLYLNKINVLCKMSDISLQLLNVKNEGFLNQARKDCYKVISILEEIATPYIDNPLSDNSEHLETISQLDDVKRFNFLNRVKSGIHLVEAKFGPNSKWKWSFVDLHAAAAAVIKNMTDFRRIQEKRDPRVPGYPERTNLLKMVQEYLKEAADKYRQKYEMVSHEPSEMKKAILLLSALMRVDILFQTSDEVQNLKKNVAVWQEKLDEDLKREDDNKKKMALKK